MIVKKSFKQAGISKRDNVLGNRSRKQGQAKRRKLTITIKEVRRAGYLLCILLALVIADGLISNSMVQSGLGKEVNPFIQSIVGKASFLSVKLLAALLCGLILWRVFCRHPKLGLVSITSFAVIYAAILGWNLTMFYIAQV